MQDQHTKRHRVHDCDLADPSSADEPSTGGSGRQQPAQQQQPHQLHHHHRHHYQQQQHPDRYQQQPAPGQAPHSASRAAHSNADRQLIDPRPPPQPGARQPQPPGGQPDCGLSNLVLSNSLHQLADSGYHTNANNRAPERPTNDHRHRHTDAASMDAADAPPARATTLDDDRADRRRLCNPAADAAGLHEPNKHQRALPTDGPANGNANTDHNDTDPGAAKQHRADFANQKREAKLDTVHVVVGNETCDLDSAVSCLLMFHIISKMSDELNGKDKARTLYIPLLNTTRDMLDTKGEVLWFLQRTLNIDKSFLTCKDDIDWTEIKRNGVEVLITLVDHNFNEEFKDIGRVVEIIDHHQVQNADWLLANQAQLRLTLDTSVGSCTTLVAERLFYVYAGHSVSEDILLLIYGTVLLDTVCLSEKAKRFTRRDVYLLRRLDQLLGSRRPVRDQLYKQLVEVKNSTRELDFEKLMKRDLKVYKDRRGLRVGIASLFGMAAKEALGLAANIDLDEFFRQNKYEAFVIMGLIADLDHSDSISRDLVLISASNKLFERLCQAFERDTSKLDLVPVSGSDSSRDPEDNVINNKRIVDRSLSSSLDQAAPTDPNFSPFYKARIWLQRNVTSSRKVVAPLVLKVLHDGAP